MKDYDYIVIGSGFGGSVAALRLAEKGYKVAVIEQGKRYRSKDFPKTNWNFRKYFWIPKIGFYGIQALSEFVIKHNFRPVGGQTFSFDEIPKAHELMESRKSMGKIVIKV